MRTCNPFAATVPPMDRNELLNERSMRRLELALAVLAVLTAVLLGH